MKRDELDRIYKKAASKADGIYTLSGTVYSVIGGCPRLVATQSGELFEVSHGFLAFIGVVSPKWQAVKKLKDIHNNMKGKP